MNTKADNQNLEQKEYLHNDSLNEQGVLSPEIQEDNKQEEKKDCRDTCMHCGMHCIYLKKD